MPQFKVGDKVKIRPWLSGNMIPLGGQSGEVIQVDLARYLPVLVKTPVGTKWYKPNELEPPETTKKGDER